MFPGLILILIGALILLNNLGVLEGGFWTWFWPLVLIIIGVYIILKQDKKG